MGVWPMAHELCVARPLTEGGIAFVAGRAINVFRLVAIRRRPSVRADRFASCTVAENSLKRYGTSASNPLASNAELRA